MSALTEAQAAQAELHKSTYWPRSQGTGNHLDLCDKHLSNAISLLSPTPPTPSIWAVAPPHDPKTIINNPVSLGLNVNNIIGVTFSDYVIDGGGDSSVLLQGTTHGCTFNRFHITRTAANPVVSYGVHAFYVKAYGNIFNDIYADNTGGHGNSSFSVRMRDNTFNRTILKGYQLVSYFEQDWNTGLVKFNQGDWTFTDDAAVWMDGGGESGYPPDVRQAFEFNEIDVHGPPGAAFLKAAVHDGVAVYAGAGVKINKCTINGRPVTAGDVGGIPSAKLTIT